MNVSEIGGPAAVVKHRLINCIRQTRQLEDFCLDAPGPTPTILYDDIISLRNELIGIARSMGCDVPPYRGV